MFKSYEDAAISSMRAPTVSETDNLAELSLTSLTESTDQLNLEIKTLRPTIPLDQTSKPTTPIAIKRTKFDRNKFARMLSVEEIYHSSVYNPYKIIVHIFYTCILYFIII